MDDPQSQNSQARRIAIGLVAVLVVVPAVWWYLQRPGTKEAAVAVADASRAAAATPPIEPPAAIRYPLTAAAEGPAPAAAPAVTDPDAEVAAGLNSLFGEPQLSAWLIPDKLLRRLVATTDNLSRNTRTEQLRPLRAPAGALMVQREAIDAAVGTERITLGAQNAARYDAAMSLLAKTDMQQAATLYRRLYPLLQRAYEELGYPDRYFNDRVIDTIDHLLATPEPAGPLLLEQPKVLYRFADADLEARSSGQKLLLRMGVAHAGVVKQKLREFRGQISSKE
jgi:hypothetical protein